MSSFDPDWTLREMRKAILRWEAAPPGSVAEAEAAEAATSAAAALDKHLSRGGALPASWANASPSTGGIPSHECTHGADCLVHPEIQAIHGDVVPDILVIYP